MINVLHSLSLSAFPRHIKYAGFGKYWSSDWPPPFNREVYIDTDPEWSQRLVFVVRPGSNKALARKLYPCILLEWIPRAKAEVGILIPARVPHVCPAKVLPYFHAVSRYIMPSLGLLNPPDNIHHGDPDVYIPDSARKVIADTGGNSGCGKQMVLQLAKHRPARIYLAARSKSKYDDAVQDILVSAPGAVVRFLELDLSSLPSVKRAAEQRIIPRYVMQWKFD